MLIRDVDEMTPAISSVERKDMLLNFVERSSDYCGAQGIAFSGVAGFSVALTLCLARVTYPSEGYVLLAWFLGLTLAPMVCLNVLANRVHQRESTGMESMAGPLDWERCLTKYLGLLVTLAGLAGCYWLFPEYRKPFYEPCWELVHILVWPGLAAAFLYIVWVDRRMKAPHDAYWHLGRLALCRWRDIDHRELGFHAASWAVKGFFLPFMMAVGAQNLEILAANGLDFRSFDALYTSGLNLLLALDVTFGALGYCLTLRVLDAQIRTTDLTMGGWLAALCCYPPFGPFLQASFLSYHGPIIWQEQWPWAQYSFLYVSWGFAVLVLHGIYVWATCSFGCRFSNLTNRGIVAEGPYQYVKHPAYISKNLAWWLMYVPFAAFGTWKECLRGCLLLGATNLIYVARAWMEERHLRVDPAYAEYRLWMQEQGLFASLHKQMGWLQRAFLRRSSAVTQR